MDSFKDQDKRNIISKVYAGQPKNEQDTFLMSLIEVKPVERKRKRSDSGTVSKENSFKYFAMPNRVRIPICKKAYMSLHALAQSKVQRLKAILVAGDSPRDMRGRHNKRSHVLPSEITIKINEHIASFPKKTTHYGSKDVVYLDARLTIKTMHGLFVKQYPELENIVKYEYYLKYFKENFALRFGRPQIDVCSTCEALGVKLRDAHLNDTAKRATAAELMVHKRRSRKFYNKLQEVQNKCKTNPEVAGFTFDYMQNLPLPNIPVQEIFYFRQLWYYLFEIHDLKDNSGHFYAYHEGQARKTPNEICTFLQDYIFNHVSPDVKELHIFSDGCPGQNRNHTVVRFLLALQATKRFKTIYHYFPIRGHSFLPCDRDFGTLKKLVRKHDRVYIPEDYESMVTECRKKQPFTVKTITYNSVINFKNWWSQYYKKTCKSLRKDEPFSISKYREFKYDSDTPGYLTCFDYIDGFISHTFKLLKPGVTPVLPTNPAYLQPVAINIKKIEDIKKILQYLSGEKLEFYYHIISWNTTAAEDND